MDMLKLSFTHICLSKMVLVNVNGKRSANGGGERIVHEQNERQ